MSYSTAGENTRSGGRVREAGCAPAPALQSTINIRFTARNKDVHASVSMNARRRPASPAQSARPKHTTHLGHVLNHARARNMAR
ncbi:hypothetical protein BD626DRAFT_567071 [Schizophyllum amplum]|uniref:Uncharacterized protein n=1 Tax=Schizophyllum amplum TaxID=97359 RepID=A0A550CK04_9AGAR|nr:hypothetical protein BD626DRAFT_567071 [Auriculariopsis ampla]